VAGKQAPIHPVRIVVDTNIVFSALVRPASSILNILVLPRENVSFFAPSYLIDELTRYLPKLQKSSQLSQENLDVALRIVMGKIHFVDEELVKPTVWEEAFTLTHDIDEKDTPFVALSIALDGMLWTGDKKLIHGLHNKGWEKAIDTSKLRDRLEGQI
jgi:predicted nucleic acid-binding protein